MRGRVHWLLSQHRIKLDWKEKGCEKEVAFLSFLFCCLCMLFYCIFIASPVFASPLFPSLLFSSLLFSFLLFSSIGFAYLLFSSYLTPLPIFPNSVTLFLCYRTERFPRLPLSSLE